jgi:hypothetical protein
MSYGGAARRRPEQVDRHHVQLNRRVPARADERKEPTTDATRQQECRSASMKPADQC